MLPMRWIQSGSSWTLPICVDDLCSRDYDVDSAFSAFEKIKGILSEGSLNLRK